MSWPIYAMMALQALSSASAAKSAQEGGEEAAAAAQRNAAARRKQAEFQAAQLEQNAGQEIAASQRDKLEQDRQTRLVASRALVLAAANGGASDPGVVRIIAGINGEGAYRAGVALYQGEEKARQMRMNASALRYQGYLDEVEGADKASMYRRQGRGGMMSALGQGAMSMFSKFGGGGPGAAGGGTGSLSGGASVDAAGPSSSVEWT